jgi:hypothetical protein
MAELLSPARLSNSSARHTTSVAPISRASTVAASPFTRTTESASKSQGPRVNNSSRHGQSVWMPYPPATWFSSVSTVFTSTTWEFIQAVAALFTRLARARRSHTGI